MAYCGQCGTKNNGGTFCTECGSMFGTSSKTIEVIPTTFENKCSILAELWITYKNDEEFEDFIAYNDLGLPLAYAVSHGIVDATPKLEGFVNDTFLLLLNALSIVDEGYEELSDLLGQD